MASDVGLALERTLMELNKEARRALSSGDSAGAVLALERAVALDRTSLTLWLNLAAAFRQAGQLDRAEGAVEEALKLAPRDFNALMSKASLLDLAGRSKDAARAYGVALLFKPKEGLDEGSAAAAARGERLAAAYTAGLAKAIDAEIASAFGSEETAAPSGLVRYVAAATGRSRIFTPQPTQHHLPGLPNQEFFDRALLPWIQDLEAATGAIRAELQAALETSSDRFTPYVDEHEGLPLDQWAALNRSPKWSALHLVRHGRQDASLARAFPDTLKALSGLPQPDVPGRTPNAMFSALYGRTRIPPHHGVSNARLVVHLPLIVPKGCAFRVGSETRPWREGEAWVFDDTIEHEAWNDGDELRIILIADIWNVFLSDAEKAGYQAVMRATDAYNGSAPGDDL